MVALFAKDLTRIDAVAPGNSGPTAGNLTITRFAFIDAALDLARPRSSDRILILGVCFVF